MNERFSRSAMHVLEEAGKIAGEFGHDYIGSEHILLALALEEGSSAKAALNAGGVKYEELRDDISKISGIGEKSAAAVTSMTPRLKRIMSTAAVIAFRSGKGFVGTEQILYAILNERDSIAMRVLVKEGVNIPAIIQSLNNSLGIGQQSAAGHSSYLESSENSEGDNNNSLEKYGKDLTKLAKDGKLDPVIGRENETDRVIQILSRRTKNNPCLIGEA